MNKLFMWLIRALVPFGTSLVSNSPQIREKVLSALAKTTAAPHIGTLLSTHDQKPNALSRFPNQLSAHEFFERYQGTEIFLFSSGPIGSGRSRPETATWENLDLLPSFGKRRANNTAGVLSPASVLNAPGKGSKGILFLAEKPTSRNVLRQIVSSSVALVEPAVVFIANPIEQTSPHPPNAALNHLEIKQGQTSSNLHGVYFSPEYIARYKPELHGDHKSFLEFVLRLKSTIKRESISTYTYYPVLLESKLFSTTPQHATKSRSILVVQPISTGGLARVNTQIYSEISSKHTVYVVQADRKQMSLIQVNGGMTKLLFRSDLRGPEGPFEHFSSDYDSSIANLISRLDIDVIHVQHLAWQSLGIGKIAQAFGVPIIYSVHDFYSICASHTLLDESNSPCFGKCTSGIGSCSAIIWPSSSLRTLKNEDVGLWQANMSSFVSQVESVIAPSEFSKDLFLRAFPQVADKTSVISHPLPSFEPISPDTWPSARSTIKALVIGDINLGKGALVLEAIAKHSESYGIEFHFLGSTWPGLSAYGVHHGSYSPEQLPTIVQTIKPHVAVLPSIAPETFSLALSELWQLGLPVVATNYGALCERILSSGGGIVAESNNPSLWVEAIKDLALPTNSRVKALESVRQWQREAAGTQALPVIAKAYAAEFEKALENIES